MFQGWIGLINLNSWIRKLYRAWERMKIYLYIFSCDQAALRTLISVRPSVCLLHLFHICSCHRIIMEFSDRSDAKGHGQRSKVKVTEVKTPFSHFRSIPPVWIHIWWWNDTQSLMWHRRGALLFFKVIRQISRSHGTKNCWFSPEFGVSGL